MYNIYAGPYPEFFSGTPLFEVVIAIFPSSHNGWLQRRKFWIFKAPVL